MNKKDLEKFRKALLDKRSDLMDVLKAKKERDMVSEVEIGDEIDTASATSQKEIQFELADNEKIILDAIEAALRRMEKGTFGLCESCRGKIADARMKAIPWVRYCIDCQSKAEKA